MLFTNPRPALADLGKYYKSEEYISHSNTKKGLISRLYHIVRKRNFKNKYRIIASLSTGKDLLDVGCATGGFLAFFKAKGWSVMGIEPDKEAREFAIRNENLDVFDEEKLLNFGNKRFDVISMWHVLEHVPFPKDRLKVLKDLLNDDGLLVVAIPNPGSYDAEFYGKYWAGYDVPRHLLHFKQEVALKFFDDMGFDSVGVKPMKFDAYYISLLSEKYKSGKTSYIKAFFVGVKSNRFAKRNKSNYSSLIFLLKKKNSGF
jgi:SAM-dependent methyltransferase